MGRLALVLLLSGCSYVWDSSAPELPLLGAPPETANLPKLNDAPASSVDIIYGADGQPWATWTQAVQTDQGPASGMRFHRLTGAAADETLVSQTASGNGADYYYVPALDGTALPTSTTFDLHVHAVGSGKPDDVYTVPAGNPLLLVDSGNTVFVWWPEAKDTTSWLIVRRDHSLTRELPIPDSVPPDNPLAKAHFLFTGDGKTLFVQDGTGDVIRRSTVDENDMDLGVLPSTLVLVDSKQLLVACGKPGLLTASYHGGPPNTLDWDPCDQGGLVWIRGGNVLYQVKGELRQVPLDGSAAPVKVLPSTERLWGFGPQNVVVYSSDPSDRYVNGAGSGIMNGWQFMQRGRNIQFSGDAWNGKGPNQRVRWLEFAAQPSGVGILTSAPINGAPTPLASNVRRYDELPDGRVLAAADHAFRGVQNRIIVIDELANAAWWVANEAADYVRIPGTNDLLVDVVSGATSFDLVRVTIPPKM